MTSFFSYIFSTLPGTEFKFKIPMLILAIALLGGAMAFSVVYKNRKKTDFAFKRLFAKTTKRLTMFGFLFLFLLAVRHENIPYFSMRLWVYISLLLLAYFAYKTIKAYKKDYPREKENVHNNLAVHKKKAAVNRYLPNKK